MWHILSDIPMNVAAICGFSDAVLMVDEGAGSLDVCAELSDLPDGGLGSPLSIQLAVTNGKEGRLSPVSHFLICKLCYYSC